MSKFTYVLTDSEDQIVGIFETFELAKENVELLCTEYEFDKYYYTNEEISKLELPGNISEIKLIVRLSLDNYSANPNYHQSTPIGYSYFLQLNLLALHRS